MSLTTGKLWERRPRRTPDGVELVQGTLGMLILKAVSLGQRHGYGILLKIRRMTDDGLRITQGSLYSTLSRLEYRGWVASEWAESENNRKAKFYQLTASGKRQLLRETEKWNRQIEVIDMVLKAKSGGT